MDKLFIYALFLYVDLISSDEYNKYLDELFLQDPDNDLLLELEYCSKDPEKSVQFIAASRQNDNNFNHDMFGERLTEELKSAYYQCGTDIKSFGDKAYLLWQKLPSDIQMMMPFSILCYADDPLSYGDERQSRNFYQEFFQYYANRAENIKVRVHFFPGERKSPPYGECYRPHFVIKGSAEYLGIEFEHLDKQESGQSIDTEVRLLYNVDYSGLIPGTEFYIMEGPHQVGEGVVL